MFRFVGCNSVVSFYVFLFVVLTLVFWFVVGCLVLILWVACLWWFCIICLILFVGLYLWLFIWLLWVCFVAFGDVALTVVLCC